MPKVAVLICSDAAVAERPPRLTWRHRYGKKHILLINNSGMLKLIAIGRSGRAAQIREKAKHTPVILKTPGWPVELELQK